MHRTVIGTMALACIMAAAHGAPPQMTIARTESGIVIQGKNWTWSVGADGLLGAFVRQGQTLVSGGHAWFETPVGGGSQGGAPTGDVTIAQEEGRAVARIKTVVQAGKGQATFDLEQRIVAGALPGYPDGAILLEYTFTERGVKLQRSALAISWPLDTYKSKLYWLEGVNRYPAEPELKSHTIFSGSARYMRLLADDSSIAVVPADYSSFQFQDNRRFGSKTYSVNIYGGRVVSAVIVPPGCRMDPAKTEEEVDDTADAEYGAIVVPGRLGWDEKTPAEGVSVPSDATASTLALPNTLHGIANHADLHEPVKLHVDYRKPGTFAIYLDGHSGYGGANLLIYLDGQLALRRDFPDATQRSMQSSRGIYRINVPQGRHTITVDNDGKDWLRIQGYVFGNYGSVPPPAPPKPPDWSNQFERVA